MKYTVRPKKDKVVASSDRRYSTRSRVVAADEDGEDDLIDYSADELIDDADFTDTLDDVADTVEDIQDAVDDIDEDDVDIEMDNNITNHYIAECEKCHGIFISAMIESDQEVEKISGVCPLCESETDQYLKWLIREVKADTEE